jgi:hypothetical protein
MNDLQCDFSQSSKIFSSISFPCPAIIFTEGYIQVPVQMVFNTPVSAHQSIEIMGVQTCFIADVITSSGCFLLIHIPTSVYPD